MWHPKFPLSGLSTSDQSLVLFILPPKSLLHPPNLSHSSTLSAPIQSCHCSPSCPISPCIACSTPVCARPHSRWGQ